MDLHRPEGYTDRSTERCHEKVDILERQVKIPAEELICEDSIVQVDPVADAGIHLQEIYVHPSCPIWRIWGQKYCSMPGRRYEEPLTGCWEHSNA